MSLLAILASAFCALPDKCVTNGVIAITFDDGPTDHTDVVLDMLADANAKATFHFTVQNVVRSNIAAAMRRAAEEGHTVGLRVNPKRNYDDMDADSIKDDLKSQVKVLSGESGDKVRFARAPAVDSAYNPDVYDALKDQGIIQTTYSYCLYHDAEDADEATEQLRKILETSSPQYESFIFLLHEEMEKSFPLLESILEIGKKKGYEFVNYDECFDGYVPGESLPATSGRSSALADKSGAAGMMAVPLVLLYFLFLL